MPPPPGRARVPSRPGGRARPGSDRPARGGSARISSYSARRSPAARSSQAANRSWSSARCSFGIAWYAASRISRWRNRNASSPANSARSGRISSLRASASSRGRTCRPQRLGGERGHRAGVEDLAFDGPALDHRALLRVEPVQARGEQQLDRRRDRDVGEVLDGAPRRRPRTAGARRRSACRASPRRTAGCPRRPRGSASRAAAGMSARPSRLSTSCDDLVARRAVRAGSWWRSASRRPSPGGARAARAGRRTAAGAARLASSPRGVRSGRGTRVRPSGCRRTRRRAVGRARDARSSLRTPQYASSAATGSPHDEEAGDQRDDPVARPRRPRRARRASSARSRDRPSARPRRPPATISASGKYVMPSP